MLGNLLVTILCPGPLEIEPCFGRKLVKKVQEPRAKVRYQSVPLTELLVKRLWLMLLLLKDSIIVTGRYRASSRWYLVRVNDNCADPEIPLLG